MKININFEIDESSAADREKAEEVITLLSDIREILNELNIIYGITEDYDNIIKNINYYLNYSAARRIFWF